MALDNNGRWKPKGWFAPSPVGRGTKSHYHDRNVSSLCGLSTCFSSSRKKEDRLRTENRCETCQRLLARKRGGHGIPEPMGFYGSLGDEALIKHARTRLKKGLMDTHTGQVMVAVVKRLREKCR